jgi:hypothetical protein
MIATLYLQWAENPPSVMEVDSLYYNYESDNQRHIDITFTLPDDMSRYKDDEELNFVFITEPVYTFEIEERAVLDDYTLLIDGEELEVEPVINYSSMFESLRVDFIVDKDDLAPGSDVKLSLDVTMSIFADVSQPWRFATLFRFDVTAENYGEFDYTSFGAVDYAHIVTFDTVI